MSSDDRRLFCLIEGDGRVFEVTVNINRSISHLKNIIHKSGEKGALSDIGAKDLTLLKVNRDLNCEDSLSRLDGEKLLAWNLVGKYWLKQPDAGRLHVLVKLPNTTDLVCQVSGAGPPPHSDMWCPRTETVKDLYEALLQEKLVYVRGTPACGKTTLMLLLVAHIKRIEPSAFVYRFSSWKHESSSESVIQGINHLYSKQGGPAFLFFDDAQDTYDDEYLWSQFFKNVADGIGHYYVVVFCSYGNPTARPVDTKYGTPPVLRSAALITLWPKKQANGRETNGLFLDRQEFNNVVERHSSNNLSKIHSDLSQLIFDWTNGHVGAVVELLNLISNGMKSRMRRGEVITVETFHEEFPVHVILLGLYGGAFGRGLPAADDVGNADLAAVFRRLLADGTIPAQQNNDSAVLTCHRRGWIYA
ncbi:hypothetical protein APHAL10511_000269 [Amanita phalloides]|nr:hypothetical protein APHAL10511_000269 [Amanita phalloides]